MEFMTAKSLDDIDFKALMELYLEGNTENGKYFSKVNGLTADEGRNLSENQFKSFLEDTFFNNNSNNIYFIVKNENTYISAVRANYMSNNCYYLEGLETNPDFRHKGYATLLYDYIFKYLKATTKLFLTIAINNEFSIKTHIKSGFIETSELGYSDIKNNVRNENTRLFTKKL